MKKEVILAIIIGFGIGLAITFGIYTARIALQKNTPSPSPTVILPSPEPSAKTILTITKPQEDTLTEAETITVKGNANPESIVTVITEDSQKIVISDKNGDFSAEVELSGGANRILITSFAPDGTKSEANVIIVYSTAEI